MRKKLISKIKLAPPGSLAKVFAALAFFAFAGMMSATVLGAAQGSAASGNLKQIQALMERGQVDAAEKQLWDIVLREPENNSAINLLGIIRTRQKRYAEADALFKRVLIMAPDYVDAYRNLGKLYELQGRNEEAEHAYAKAHELDPRDVKTTVALGSIYEQNGKFAPSIEILTSIPSGQIPSEALPVLAADYFALKEPNKVAALAPKVAQAAVSNPPLIPRFARVLADNGFVDDAQELLQTATPRQRLRPEYLLVLARVQERQGKLALAEQTLARVAKMDPASFEAFFQAARIASQGKHYEKEASLLDKALQIQPENIEALHHLVLARMRSGDAVAAVNVARRLYALQPENPDALYLMGAALANHGEWHDARPVVEKLLTVRDDATTQVLVGMTLLNDGDIEGASAHIERALQQNPNEIEAHYYKGVIARQHGDLPGATKELEVAINANPQHAQAQAELGIVALQMGNMERARQAFEQAVLLRPDIPENHYQLALAYKRLGLQDKAGVEMTEFQKLKKAADQAKLQGITSKDSKPESQSGSPRN